MDSIYFNFSIRLKTMNYTIYVLYETTVLKTYVQSSSQRKYSSKETIWLQKQHYRSKGRTKAWTPRTPISKSVVKPRCSGKSTSLASIYTCMLKMKIYDSMRRLFLELPIRQKSLYREMINLTIMKKTHNSWPFVYIVYQTDQQTYQRCISLTVLINKIKCTILNI